MHLPELPRIGLLPKDIKTGEVYTLHKPRTLHAGTSPLHIRQPEKVFALTVYRNGNNTRVQICNAQPFVCQGGIRFKPGIYSAWVRYTDLSRSYEPLFIPAHQQGA